jgi:rod shape-determining protein MreC
MESLRSSSFGFVRNYIILHDADAENRRLKAENDHLRMENIFLKNELNTADRAKALQLFQQHTPSKTIAATVYSTLIGPSRKAVFIDRGSVNGVMREMAVVTPDGIIGKVTNVYPNVSEVLLITDLMFAAGVISGKTHAHGTLKGTGTSLCKVDNVASEDKVEPGDWFYTSGDDRIFPRGMPVGVVKSVKPGQPPEITLDPSGMAKGSPDDVLIVIEGVHQEIPDTPPANQQVYMAVPPPPPPADPVSPPGDGSPATRTAPGTEADKTRALYQKTADSEDIVLGGGATGQNIKRPPDFTKLPVDPRSVAQGRGSGPGSAAPPVVPAAKKSTAPPPKGTAPGNPDAVRHANQAAGGPGGMQ